MLVARRFLISGRVQNVGFRWFAESAAAREGVHGWIRNLPDGRVEAQAEGDAEALERFERALEVLKEADRQVIVMRVELGFDNDEIARELGKSPDAARMALTRALTRLAAEMQRSK